MARASKSLKIRKGDTVVVLAGKDRGKRGVVKTVDKEQHRVVVEGVNIVKRHTKARPAQSSTQANRQPESQGGVIEKPAAIHVSNVALVSPGTGEATRVGFRFVEGRKIRVARRDNVDIDETKGK